MNDSGEEQPAVFVPHIDLLQIRPDVNEVSMVVDMEKAKRLEVIAEKLGGFSVSIAAQGDGLEDKVTVHIKNTGHPNTPKDLDRLWAHVRAEE